MCAVCVVRVWCMCSVCVVSVWCLCGVCVCLLASVGASGIPIVRVFNKIDLVSRPVATSLNDAGEIERIDVSALHGLGLEQLNEAIILRLNGKRIRTWISLEGRHAKLRSQLFDLGAVEEEKVTEDGQWLLHVDLSHQDARQLGRLPGPEGKLIRKSILSILSPLALAARQGET